VSRKEAGTKASGEYAHPEKQQPPDSSTALSATHPGHGRRAHRLPFSSGHTQTHRCVSPPPRQPRSGVLRWAPSPPASRVLSGCRPSAPREQAGSPPDCCCGEAGGQARQKPSCTPGPARRAARWAAASQSCPRTEAHRNNPGRRRFSSGSARASPSARGSHNALLLPCLHIHREHFKSDCARSFINQQRQNQPPPSIKTPTPAEEPPSQRDLDDAAIQTRCHSNITGNKTIWQPPQSAGLLVPAPATPQAG